LKADIVVIEVGIVGLSTACHLIKEKSEVKVILLEKEATFTLHQTRHISGVINSRID
jgi:L-2-hydroxyglutarate oxidase